MKVLAIDQGTTSTKAFTYDDAGGLTPVMAREHTQHYPHRGWVEHDPEELLANVQACIAAAGKVDALGIDNQGETLLAWDSRTGRPCYRAIVWQDDRTRDTTDKLKSEGAEELVLARTGLPLDPYFSASKMRWIVDHVDDARALLKQGRLRIGTSDAFFLDRLCDAFATDVTTASRTSLMSLDTLDWDDELLSLFGVPRECLPSIRPTTDVYGDVGGSPITANIVDQQAALFGHGCEKTGDAKITFGTGAFALAIAGNKRPRQNEAGLAATVAWTQGREAATFALDGGIYNAGSAVNWARSIGLFTEYPEISRFAARSAISRGIVFVPALSGMACPHWDRTAAGLFIGLGLDTSRSDLMQAVLEGIALRTSEVVDAIASVLPIAATISIDGGLSENEYFAQFLSNCLDRPVSVASSAELTALGTARMTMIGAGAPLLPQLPEPARQHRPDARVPVEQRSRFSEAVARARSWR